MQTLYVAALQAASDINSPVSGTVKEVNEALNDEPAKVGCCHVEQAPPSEPAVMTAASAGKRIAI